MILGLRVRRILWAVRRLISNLTIAFVVAGTAALVALGWFPDLRVERIEPAPLGLISVLTTLVLVRIADRLRALSHADGSAVHRADLELGALLIATAYAALALTGGLRSQFYPLIYALIAFVATFQRRVIGVALIVIAFCFEALACSGAVTAADGAALAKERAIELGAAHFAFLGFFSLVHLVFLQGAFARQKRNHRAHIATEIRTLRDEARDFRLISASLTADPKSRDRAHDEERLAIGAVETIHQTLFYTLEMLKRTLGLHTCMLLWLDDSGEQLKIKESVTDSEHITELPLPAAAGALGTVVKNRILVNLQAPKQRYLPYYAGPEQIDSFLGVPVQEHGHLRGVLCADRIGGRPFDENDERVLQEAAIQILRSIQSERVFAAVERAKYEHERFFGALALLNRSLTPSEVSQTTFEAARSFCEFDFGAITLFDRATKRHSVIAAVGEKPAALDGLSFADNAGLCAMVVKNKHYLPAAGEVRDKDMMVYTKAVKLEKMESLLVMPLVIGEEAIGTFAVASQRTRAFGKDKREMLGVIANHIAVKLSNAQLYGRMEEMATTDGLTGLVNHRTFQERFGDMLARAERSSGKLALMLTDIDHFKKVNDTYGHPVGDIVLKGVARVVHDCVRKVDLAARYGGEEFAVVLEGTDLAGARQLAERIRQEVQKQVFQSDKGPFSVTLSLGIAAYPDDGKEQKGLIALADQALYDAKHGGRNRAVAYADIAARGLKAI